MGAVPSITLALAPVLDIKQRLAYSQSKPPVKGSFGPPAVCFVGRPALRAVPCTGFTDEHGAGEAVSSFFMLLRTSCMMMP